MQVHCVEDRGCSPALVRRADEAHAAMCRSQRELFGVIAEIDRNLLWKHDGARDMAHWLWMRYGLSEWKARRWIAAAHALTSLPVVSNAFASGALGVDKVVELCRFATVENEETLVVWAQRVSAGAIRSRGDREIRQGLEDVREIERSRYLLWWHEDDGRSLCLEGRMPVAAGAVVMRALERVADQLPASPGELDPPAERHVAPTRWWRLRQRASPRTPTPTARRSSCTCPWRCSPLPVLGGPGGRMVAATVSPAVASRAVA